MIYKIIEDSFGIIAIPKTSENKNQCLCFEGIGKVYEIETNDIKMFMLNNIVERYGNFSKYIVGISRDDISVNEHGTLAYGLGTYQFIDDDTPLLDRYFASIQFTGVPTEQMKEEALKVIRNEY